MNEFILFRVLFFIAMILLAASIITVVAFASSLVARSRSKDRRHKKSKTARKRNAVAVSDRNRENPMPVSTSLTINNCWLHRI